MSSKLKDIATRAGVSVSTVSRVINNDPAKPASPETAAMVWQIVHELQYVPNQTARMLIHRAKDGSEKLDHKSIGCILAAYDDLFSDPFFSEVIAGVQGEVGLRGYSMEYTFPVSATGGPQDSNFFNSISTRKVSGAVLLGRVTRPLLDMLRAYIPHLVYCGLNYIDADIPQVICDAVQGFTQLMEYLVGKGHRRIGFVGETNRGRLLMNERRFLTYQREMERCGLPVEERYVLESGMSLSGGYRSMQKALAQPDHASAYVCVNDITAIGAMRAIVEKGLSIPQDISIAAFDDIEMCSYITPRLTTIHTPMKAMGQMAVRTLLEQFGDGALPVRSYVPLELIERESCREWKE